MFPQLKKVNNESGVVLFIVLMTAIIIMIFSVSILTQSMNEMNYAQQQIDQITSDEMAKGVFWNYYSTSIAVSNTVSWVNYQNESGNETTIGRNYELNITNTTATPVDGITNYAINVSYDTFQ